MEQRSYNPLAEQSRAEQSRAEQSRAEQNRAEQLGLSFFVPILQYQRKTENHQNAQCV